MEEFMGEFMDEAIAINVNGSFVMEGMDPGTLAVFAGVWLVRMLICCAIGILMLVAMWKILSKAKLPGWWVLIPVYNVYLLFKLAGRPGGWTWWILFPPVLCVLTIIAQFDIAKRFGKDVGYGFGLWLLPVIFYPILAFGGAKYTPMSKK